MRYIFILKSFFRGNYVEVMTSASELLPTLRDSGHDSWTWSVPDLQYRGEGNANLVVAMSGTYKVRVYKSSVDSVVY